MLMYLIKANVVLVVLFGFLAVLLLSGSWAGRTGAVQGAPS